MWGFLFYKKWRLKNLLQIHKNCFIKHLPMYGFTFTCLFVLVVQAFVLGKAKIRNKVTDI